MMQKQAGAQPGPGNFQSACRNSGTIQYTTMSAKSRGFRFVQLDVFASQPFSGNPLAVFSDGRGLTDTEMQAIAREMNLSETTFILPRDPEIEKERGVRVRI